MNSKCLKDPVFLPYTLNFIAVALALRCKVCNDRLGMNHSAYMDKRSVSTLGDDCGIVPTPIPTQESTDSPVLARDADDSGVSNLTRCWNAP